MPNPKENLAEMSDDPKMSREQLARLEERHNARYEQVALAMGQLNTRMQALEDAIRAGNKQDWKSITALAVTLVMVIAGSVGTWSYLLVKPLESEHKSLEAEVDQIKTQFKSQIDQNETILRRELTFNWDAFKTKLETSQAKLDAVTKTVDNMWLKVYGNGPSKPPNSQ